MRARYSAMVGRAEIWKFLLMLLLLTCVMAADVALLNLIASSLRVGTDWKTFVPDLVVGLITTGVLGLLLWYFSWHIERRAERRETARLARLRWSIVGRRVANIVNTEKFEDHVLDASNLGPIAQKLVNLLQDEPLAEWHAVLGEAEIELTLGALNRLEKTIALGRAINEQIRSWHLTSRFSKPLSSDQARAILVGGSYGFSFRETALTMGVKRRHVSAVIKEIENNLDADLDGKIAAYTLSRLQAETDVGRLKARSA